MKARYFYTCMATALLCVSFATAQPFSSGSTGLDGALNYPTSGTYNFDPAALGLNAAGDNIFNFTTINIAAGVTLNLQSSFLRGKPVIFLATGNVTISGALVLDGASGPNLASFGADWIAQRVPTQPGPGGFPGGVGARPGTPAYPGLGPGGAPIQTNQSCNIGGSGSFGTAGSSIPPSSTYGNIQLVPLIGGSGGSGGCVAPSNPATDAAGGTGAAGGGAIRIVSSTSIAVNGRISAAGGFGGAGRSGGTSGGAGAGGAINLIAPTVTGTGQLTVQGGNGGIGNGYVLLNATNNTFTGYDTGGILTLRPLIAPPLPAPTTQPTVTINSVNGVSVPQPPQGAFQTPDVTINSATAVTINISAVGVPVGTVVQLNVQSELAADQIISCNPLAGTSASSTATCSATFPTSVSRILASAKW